jgi:L-fuculose-phosphate aldolase
MTVTTPTRSAMLVAAASRALAVAGIFDMNGHVSVREGSVAYVSSHGASRLALRAEEVAVVRIADGKELEHTPPSEMPLHLGAYRARPDVGAVVHAHPLFATTFAVAGRPLVCAFNAGAWFGHDIPVFDDPALVRDEAGGRTVAGVLADRRAALLRGHGVLVVGEDIPTVVAGAILLEDSARRLWHAYAIGEPRRFTDAEIETVRAQTSSPRVIRKWWLDALERAKLAGVLDDIDISTLV